RHRRVGGDTDGGGGDLSLLPLRRARAATARRIRHRHLAAPLRFHPALPGRPDLDQRSRGSLLASDEAPLTIPPDPSERQRNPAETLGKQGILPVVDGYGDQRRAAMVERALEGGREFARPGDVLTMPAERLSEIEPVRIAEGQVGVHTKLGVLFPGYQAIAA